MKTFHFAFVAALYFGSMSLLAGMLQSVYTPEVMQHMKANESTIRNDPSSAEVNWLTVLALQPAPSSDSSGDVDADQDLQTMSSTEKLKNAESDRDVSRQAINTIQSVQEGARTRGDATKQGRVNELLREALSLYSGVEISLQALDQAIKSDDVSEQLTQAKNIRRARERIKELEEEALGLPDTDPTRLPNDLPSDPSEFGFGLNDTGGGAAQGAASGTGAGGGGTGGGGGGGGGGAAIGGLGSLAFAAAAIGSNNNRTLRLASPFFPEPFLTPEQFGATGGGELFPAGSGVITD